MNVCPCPTRVEGNTVAQPHDVALLESSWSRPQQTKFYLLNCLRSYKATCNLANVESAKPIKTVHATMPGADSTVELQALANKTLHGFATLHGLFLLWHLWHKQDNGAKRTAGVESALICLNDS